MIVIEHNMGIIKVTDHIINLDPEGGGKGGRIFFEGTPEDFQGRVMKPFCIYFLSAFISISSIAQNLIQNPDFEDDSGNLECSYWEISCRDTCTLN